MAGRDGKSDWSSIWVSRRYVPQLALLVVDAVLLRDRQVRVVLDLHPGVVEECDHPLCFFLCGRHPYVESFGSCGFDAVDGGLELCEGVVLGDGGQDAHVLGEFVADLEDVVLGDVCLVDLAG